MLGEYLNCPLITKNNKTNHCYKTSLIFGRLVLLQYTSKSCGMSLLGKCQHSEQNFFGISVLNGTPIPCWFRQKYKWWGCLCWATLCFSNVNNILSMLPEDKKESTSRMSRQTSEDNITRSPISIRYHETVAAIPCRFVLLDIVYQFVVKLL